MKSFASEDLLGVTAVARPVRVAILIDLEAVTCDELDAITQQCLGYWGGTFWPIVPCDGSSLTDDWWKVLEAVDPDVVIAVCGLGRELCHELHRRVAPSKVIDLGTVVDARRNDASLHLNFREVGALDAYEAVEYLARNAPLWRPPRFLLFEDSREPAPSRAFIARNFGITQKWVRTEAAFRLADTQRVSVNAVTSIEALALTHDYRVDVVPARRLPSFYAPRAYDVDYDQPSNGFQLIIGNTAKDIVLAWNRSLTSRGHLGRDFLWIDVAAATDETFVTAVGEWIKRAFWNNQNQETGAVLSYSQPLEVLSSLAEKLSKATWMQFRPVQLSHGAFPFKATRYVGQLQLPSTIEHLPRRTEHIPLSDGEGLLTVPRPPFAQSQSKTDGWMLDLTVDYLAAHRRYSNRKDTWLLPRRALLGRLFSRGRHHARVVRNHLPSVSVTSAESSIPIRTPTKRTLLTHLFEPPPPCRSEPAERHFPRTRFQSIQTSEQGLRFRAIVDLFGGVGSAGRLFEDVFWRTFFLEGSGKPVNELERLTAAAHRELADIADQLRSRAPGESAGTPLDIAAAARRLASRLRVARARPVTFTRKHIGSRFSQLMKGEVIHTDNGARQIKFSDHGEDTLEWLLRAGALQQGVVLACETCGTLQWRLVDELATSMHCQDCTADLPLPPSPEWHFRVSGLIQNALADHGVLSVLHAVVRYTERARDLAVTIAPQELRARYDGDPITDLDLIVVCDGEFVIGEVKSSPEGVDSAQLKRLADVAREIHPDKVVVAATGQAWPPEASAAIEELKGTLELLRIPVEATLLNW